ncbi:MAG TPA: response regulator transcription factor [Candidatus Blautia pullicola]|uniref:Stage 0 sporulation protein A homolog n=1 Tax=Candidatus Blautia pullicola TaxID=2838498 RepID=A0A9D2JR46_9FIRM|nr:response regulator transcription factor [Candidatus Blautia pullicola]
MKKIAVVEDDLVLREALTGLLEENGYETCVVEDFQRAREVLLAMEPDLVLLDILLPGANGQEILRSLRKESQIPVIMLTSRSGDMDEILSMSYGADDYIVKPYNPTLLLLKLEALFRRMGPKEHTEEIQYGPVTVNLLRSTMRWEDREVVLSKNEISILYYLVKNRGRIVSRDELMDYLWDCSDFVDDNTLTVNMNRLRKKLQEAGVEHAVETRRKQGYILI